MQIDTDCICLSFLWCEFSNFSSKHSDHNRHNDIGCTDLTFLHCVPSKVISNFLNEQRKTLLCFFKWFLKLPAPKDAWSHWLHLMTFFSTVGFRMYPHIGWPGRCNVTLVAFIWLFSTVRYQMYPQIACLCGCKVTLVAFIWLFSKVCFQMSPQITCPRRCKVTLVAFVWLFSSF